MRRLADGRRCSRVNEFFWVRGSMGVRIAGYRNKMHKYTIYNIFATRHGYLVVQYKMCNQQ
jgi:hypothetical protein